MFVACEKLPQQNWILYFMMHCTQLTKNQYTKSVLFWKKTINQILHSIEIYISCHGKEKFKRSFESNVKIHLKCFLNIFATAKNV